MASIIYRSDRKRWYVYWSTAGRRHGKSFPKDQKKEAKDFAHKIELEKPRGDVAIDLQTAAVHWCEDRLVMCSPRTYERYASVIRRFTNDIGPATPLRRINTHTITQWRNDRLASRTPCTVRADLKVIQAFARWIAKRKWIEAPFTDGIEMPKLKRRVPRFLAPDQIEQCIAATKATGRPEFTIIATLAADAGLRRNEILFLRWADIDFNNRQLTITGKSKDPRIVPMTHRVHAALMDWPQSGPLIFPPKYKTANVRSPHIAKQFNAWLRDHGFNLTLHGLRHSFAVRLVSRGASERAVGDLLGHQDLATTRIYARAHLDYLRQIVEPQATPHPSPNTSPAPAPTKETPPTPPAATTPAPPPSPKVDKSRPA